MALLHGLRVLTTASSAQQFGSRTLLEEVMEGKPLTPREIEILQLASEGDSAQESADRIYLAYETVKGYRKRIVAKLGAKNITEAVAMGIRTHLIH